jgi:hypothetical protein
MSDAETAYAAAQALIEKARKDGATGISFDIEDCHALTRIPPEIADLNALTEVDLGNTAIADLRPLSTLTGLHNLRLAQTGVTDLRPLTPVKGLQFLNLDSTQVNDLAPLADLSELVWLSIDSTKVRDLRPIADLSLLSEEGELSFRNTPAARATRQLAELSQREDGKERAKWLRPCLSTFPPWPEPIPWEIGADLEGKIDDALSRLNGLQTDLSAKTDEIHRAEGQLDSLANALEEARSRLKNFEYETARRIEATKEDYDKSMQAAEEAFREDLAIREPVQLWQDKQKEHESNRDRAFNLFRGGLAAIGLAIVLLVVTLAKAPEFVDTLLGPAGCDTSNPDTCKGFGLRGVFVTAATLTFLTVLLWFTRLQMKLYLAERHMVLDSRERRAFAQTYLGFLKEGDTSQEAQQQRALVYTSLFRPSSDGTIKEDGGLDPAVTAAISKILSR